MLGLLAVLQGPVLGYTPKVWTVPACPAVLAAQARGQAHAEIGCATVEIAHLALNFEKPLACDFANTAASMLSVLISACAMARTCNGLAIRSPDEWA